MKIQWTQDYKVLFSMGVVLRLEDRAFSDVNLSLDWLNEWRL